MAKGAFNRKKFFPQQIGFKLKEESNEMKLGLLGKVYQIYLNNLKCGARGRWRRSIGQSFEK